MIPSVMRLLTRRGLAVALAAGMLAAAPAQACQYDFAPEPIGGPSARFIMPRMFAAATFVDLAMAEGSQPIALQPGGQIPQGASLEALSFRVVQRWKGSSADRFMLFGTKGDGTREWDMTHWTDEKGRVYPYMSVRELAPPDGWQFNSCSPPVVSAAPGTLHVVFREADGRLLGAVRFHEDMREVAGTAIAPIDPLKPSDWDREARVAGAYAEQWKLPEAVSALAPDTVSVRFRQPLTAAAVKTLLASTGGAPFGVTLVRGSVTMEYRLGSEPAAHPLIDDAVAWAQRTDTPRAPLTRLAGDLADTYPLSSFAGEPQRLAADVLRLLRSPAKPGSVLISGVQLHARPSTREAFARRPEVAQVSAGRRVRGRLAVDSLAPPPEAPLPPPAETHRGLAAAAGRAVSPGQLSGKWTLVGSYTPLNERALTLEFSGDQVRATMPCADASSAGYRIEGQVLELKLAKPDLGACPQRRAFWTAAEVFDRELFTVRLAGNRMRLLTDNGGDLEFVR